MLRLATLCLALVLAGPALAQTGQSVPEMAAYDAFFPDFLSRHSIPGAAVAVSRDGRLVYARGFGLADVAAGEAVEPTDRFRLASISKSITGVVTMKLVEDGTVDLDAPAFAFLPDLPAPAGQTEDARLAQITIRDLLQHSGGWDRDGSGYDPMFDNANIASAMGVAQPADVETIIRYMRGRPLNFTPGTRYAYSNFGYAVMGRVLERITGTSYDQLVRETLGPLNMTSLALGGSRLDDRLPNEVLYYPTTSMVPSVFTGASVPWPYGGFLIEAMDAHGGWVSSAPDLLRLTAALDGRANRPDLLSASSQATLTARPGLSTWSGTNYWYGLGWSVNTNGHWWHLGSLPGSESLVVRSNYQGLHWAVLLNARPPQGSQALGELDGAMWTLALGVSSWPTHDLFDTAVASEPRPTGGVDLAVTPNPARARAVARLTLDTATDATVDVLDALGRTVRRLHHGTLAAGTHPFELNAADLPTGTYLVRVRTPGGVRTQAVSIVR